MHLPTFIRGWETVELLRHTPYGIQYKLRNNMGEFSLLRVTDIPASLELHRNLTKQGSAVFNSYCQNEISKFEKTLRIMYDFSSSPYILKPLEHIIHPFSNCNGFAFFARYEFLPTINSVFIERTLENAVKLFRDLCNGLRPIHQNNMLYGNILPSNIFFGNTFKLGEIVPYSPQTAFTPLEVFNGGPIGFHTDIYSVGAVVAWFLTSTPPPHSFTMLNGGIGYVISKACAMNPVYRYSTIDEILSDLDSIFPINTNAHNQTSQENKQNNIQSTLSNETPVINSSISETPIEIPSQDDIIREAETPTEIPSQNDIIREAEAPTEIPSQDDIIREAEAPLEIPSQNNIVTESASSTIDTSLNISPEKSSEKDNFFCSTMPTDNVFGSTQDKSSTKDDFFGSTMPTDNMFGSTQDKSSQSDDFFGSTMPIDDMFGSTPPKSSTKDDFFGSTMPTDNVFGSTPEKSSQSDDF